MAALKWSSIVLTAALLSFVICSAAQPITERVGEPAPAPSAEDNMIDSEMALKKNDNINCNCGGGCGCGQAPGKQYYCRPANCGGDPACGGGFTMSFDSYVPASANAHD